MSKSIINGIDVSECAHLDKWKHCNICKELIKTVPNRHQCLTEQDLRCEYYSNCNYKQFKRLEQKNKYLTNEVGRLGHYIETHYPSKDFLVDNVIKQNISLEQENEKLKKNQCYSETCEHITTEIIRYSNVCEINLKYKQALEEIKKEANRLLYEENPIYGYNNSNYFELLAKYVLAKTDEVLNDRD